MFITNLSGINFSTVYKCGKVRADHLINKCGFTLLSIDENGKYVFSHTNELDKALNELPFCIKVFHK